MTDVVNVQIPAKIAADLFHALDVLRRGLATRPAAGEPQDEGCCEAARPDVKQFSTGAVRGTDCQGVRYDLISPVAMRRLAAVYAEGCAKYGPDNWLKGIPASDLINHLSEHLAAWRSGDRSEDHLGHAMWNLATLIHFEETRQDMMDGHWFRNPKEPPPFV